MSVPFKSTAVEYVFDQYPERLRLRLLSLRELIYSVAAANSRIGALEESLKWGQPSFVPVMKSGTAIRLAIEKKNTDRFGIYVNCSTTIIETFRHIYGDEFEYDSNRGVLFHSDIVINSDAIEHFITIAFTYHQI